MPAKRRGNVGCGNADVYTTTTLLMYAMSLFYSYLDHSDVIPAVFS